MICPSVMKMKKKSVAAILAALTLTAGVTAVFATSKAPLDVDKLQALKELEQDLTVVLARAICKNISRAEVHQLVDELFDSYGNLDCRKKSGEQ